jgi:hypothetical protein
MPEWARGEAEVEQLIARGGSGASDRRGGRRDPAAGAGAQDAATAAGLVSSDPYSAYVLAYDAARFACIALLAQQGLRATTSGRTSGPGSIRGRIPAVRGSSAARSRSATAEPGPLDALRAAELEHLRGQIALDQGSRPGSARCSARARRPRAYVACRSSRPQEGAGNGYHGG